MSEAKELVEKFMDIKIGQKHNDDGTMVYSSRKMYESEAKKCALICIKELMIECKFMRESYWYEVKNEIEKL